jgi:hypothetical protein
MLTSGRVNDAKAPAKTRLCEGLLGTLIGLFGNSAKSI